MLILTCFLLLIIAYLGNGEAVCPENVMEVCEYPIQQRSFPKCESELESLCLRLKNFSECVINYKEMCPNVDGPPLIFAQSLLSTSNKFCVKDSVWFKGVIKYGGCYDNFFDVGPIGGKCAAHIEDTFNLLFLNMSNEPGLYRCYNDIRIASCIIEKLPRKCGKMATELALHFFNGVGFWNAFCLNHKEKAMKMMEDIEITFNPETTEEEFVTLFEEILASYGTNKDKCLSNYKNLCKYPGYFVLDFPENSAKLIERCTEHKKYSMCLIDYQNDCGDEIWGINSVHDNLNTLNTFCNESSVLFHAVAEKGKCYNKYYQLYGEKTDRRIATCIQEIRDKDPVKFEEEHYQRYPGDYNKRMCFFDLEYIKCLSEEISNKCGEVAKEIMLQAISHNRMQYTLCKDFIEEAEVYMMEMNFNLDPKYSFQDFISLLENETE